MEPGLHFPKRRTVLETEDIAADFVEQELGRHDWMHNWPVYKSKHADVRTRIAEWLKNAGYEADPADIEKTIERMLLMRPGRWR